LFCFVSFFSRTNGMNSNEYFKSVSYGLIQTIFETNFRSAATIWISSFLALSLSRAQITFLIVLMLLCLLQD
jgi:hypothetical protein